MTPPFRRPRFSKRPESQESTTAVQGVTPLIEPFSNVSEESEDSSFRYGFSMAPPDHASRPGRELPSTSSDRPELRREHSILAELRGSESAMGITKKVGDPYT